MLGAQTYEKDWDALNKKFEKGVQVPLHEMETFTARYKDKLSSYPDNSMQLFSSIAIECFNKGKIAEAEQNYLNAYKFSKTAADTSLKHIAEYYLASFYHNQDNLQEAEKYYVLCLYGMAAVYGQSSREYTQIFFNYTAVLFDLQKYQQAQPYIEALLYYYKTLDGEKSFKYINLLNYKAIIAQNLGQYQQAIEILTPIVNDKVLLALGDTSNQVIMQSNLGDVYREYGKYDLAIVNLKKARQQFFSYKLKNRGTQASIENNLALCYKAINSTKEAEESYNNALAIYKDLKETTSEAYCSTLSNKADLYRELGRLGEASELLLTALQIRKEKFGTQTENYANALSNLANVYFDAGYFKEALEKNLEANAIYKEVVGEWHQGYGNSLNNLSLCYLQFKDYKKAEEYKTKALQVIEHAVGKDHYRYASYLISTCGLYRKTGQAQRAEINLKEALQLVAKNFGKKHELYARTQFALAELYCISSRFEEATPLYYEALDYYAQQLNSYFDAMSEDNQINYFQFIDPVFQSYDLYLLNYRIAKPGKDLSEQTKRALRYQLLLKSMLTSKSARVGREVFNSGDKELVDLYKSWVTVKNELINNFKSAQPAFENNELAKKASDLETALKTKLKGFGKGPEVNFTSIKNALKDNEAAIELFKVTDHTIDTSGIIKYGALIVKKNSLEPELIVLRNGNTMEGPAFDRYSDAIDNQKEDRESYSIYFKSFEAALKGIDRLYVSADGVFQKINLLGLQDPTTGKFLADNLEIFQASNLGSILNAAEENSTSNRSAVLFGYPDYEYDFKKQEASKEIAASQTVAKRFGLTNLSKLPGTKTEVEEISKELKAAQWKPVVYTNEQASEENLRKVSSPAILHIATHGFYLKDIETEDKSFLGFETNTFKNNSLLRSGIILAGAGPATNDSTHTNSENDGIVTAYEASLLNLTNTDLVVLSACQTGLGDEMGSQGVAGLQRSLTIAGAKNMIMSLWPVDDDATKNLMTEFYKEYASTKDVETSFKNARSTVRLKYPHPYYWAAFVLLKTFH
jgi:CHAT domain-containing protein